MTGSVIFIFPIPNQMRVLANFLTFSIPGMSLSTSSKIYKRSRRRIRSAQRKNKILKIL